MKINAMLIVFLQLFVFLQHLHFFKKNPKRVLMVLTLSSFFVVYVGIFDNIDCHTMFLPATTRSLLQDLSAVCFNTVVQYVFVY